MVSLLGRDQGGKNTTFSRLKMPSHFTNKISQKGIQTKGLLVPKIHQEKGRHDYMEEGLTLPLANHPSLSGCDELQTVRLGKLEVSQDEHPKNLERPPGLGGMNKTPNKSGKRNQRALSTKNKPFSLPKKPT